MLPVCLRFLLTFLLLTAAAPQAVSPVYASEPASLDEAPAASVSIGNKTPEPTGVESYTLYFAPRAERPHWPGSVTVPLVLHAPRCARRAISRFHWVRRRIPRLRDDAPDH